MSRARLAQMELILDEEEEEEDDPRLDKVFLSHSSLGVVLIKAHSRHPADCSYFLYGCASPRQNKTPSRSPSNRILTHGCIYLQNS